MRLLEQLHIGAGLPDAAADAQGNFIVNDGLVVREVEKIEL
jgi:hypothetical protein